MSRPLRTPVIPFILCIAALRLLGSGARAGDDPLERRLAAEVRPFLERYCHSCHGPKKPKAGLDLGRDATAAAVAKNARAWGLVLERIAAGEMPPEDAPRRPGSEERAAVVAWLRELRDREVQRTAGDPGTVLARRLSNAALDCTIRDLTGVDIRPTREFPVDPANEAGFDNSGESLAMSPALLAKYLAAARRVADRAVLKPEGFAFAPHPVATDTDRDKYCVRRIVDFYERHKVDYADYFLAAWRFEHRAALGKPKAILDDFAAEAGLSPRYLAAIRSLLHEAPSGPGPLADVQEQWRKLPADALRQDEVRRECERLRDLVVRLRKGLAPRVERLTAKGISAGSPSSCGGTGSSPRSTCGRRRTARTSRASAGSFPTPSPSPSAPPTTMPAPAPRGACSAPAST